MLPLIKRAQCSQMPGAVADGGSTYADGDDVTCYKAHRHRHTSKYKVLTSAPYLAVCSCQSRARAFSVAAILDLIVKMSSLMRRSPEKGDVQSADRVTYVRKKLAVCGHAHAGFSWTLQWEHTLKHTSRGHADV
jgi:hypothetical protein